MTKLDIIPPDEARKILTDLDGPDGWTVDLYHVRDLAHTAAVRGDRLAEVLALHRRAVMQTINSAGPRGGGPTPECVECSYRWPCLTARALGVTE